MSLPEEFIDPLLGEIMRDPVQLPNSKVQFLSDSQGCDRSDYNKETFTE